MFSVSHAHFRSQKDSEGYYNAQLRDEETQTTDTQPVNEEQKHSNSDARPQTLIPLLLLSSRLNQNREARAETGQGEGTEWDICPT